MDCGAFLDEIRALGRRSNPLALEQILTRARLPVILANIRPKTLIYTYYIDGIDRLLRDALIEKGWKVGFYTGEDKAGLNGFINGRRGRADRHQRDWHRRGRPATGLQPPDRQRLALDAAEFDQLRAGYTARARNRTR